MPGTLHYSTTLTTLTCGNCSIPFAIPTNLYNKVTKDGSYFWCPNGHKIHYYETEEQRLRKRLEDEQRRSIRERNMRERAEERALHEKRSHAATKGHLTKTKKRVGGGVCPCCNRSFENLANHMKGQHPDYGK